MDAVAEPAIKIYGTRGSAACYSIRDFLHRSDVPFQWIDLTSDEQAQREAQPEVGGRDRVRALPRERRGRRGSADHDRVEWPVEAYRLGGRLADKRLRVGDRGCAAEDRADRQLAWHAFDHAHAQLCRQHREAEPEPRADDSLELTFRVRIAAENAGQIKAERDARHGHANGQQPLDLQRELPASRRARFEERHRTCRSQRLRVARVVSNQVLVISLAKVL